MSYKISKKKARKSFKGKPSILDVNYLRIMTGMNTVLTSKKQYISFAGKPFLKYVHRNKTKLAKSFYNALSSIPDSMGTMDNRMDISGLFVCQFLSDFGGHGTRNVFKFIDNQHYDVEFRSLSGVEKISFKTQRTLFQKINKNGSISVPKSIIIKNGLGGNTKVKQDESDYLVAVQRQVTEENQKFAFAVVSFDKIYKKIKASREKQTPEIKCQLFDNEWDFFYSSPYFLPEKDKEKLERIYSKLKSLMFDSLLSVPLDD